jgi:hypothetical protein
LTFTYEKGLHFCKKKDLNSVLMALGSLEVSKNCYMMLIS